jgi:hypothetical protein
VQNHADGRYEHGHDEKLLQPDDENDERLRHADDDELQRHADDVLHLLIARNIGRLAGDGVFESAIASKSAPTKNDLGV